MMTNDNYEILGLTPQASATDIRRAYIRMVKRYHPDGVHPRYKELAEHKLRQVILAYKALCDQHNQTLRNHDHAETKDKKTVIRPTHAKNDNTLTWGEFARISWNSLAGILKPRTSEQEARRG
ncbi:MAG: DnaJ domain-containing protein [Rhodospirillales bacterium]|nr:DnaJ domain-containing protein [Rhodospirillales bacterium]